MRLLRKYWKWLAALIVAIVVVARVKLAPVAVEAYTVAPTNIIAEVMGTGTLEARVKTTISPRIQERLAEMLVDQNDSVQTDQLLARLDDGELKKQVEVATATLASAEATVERVRVDEARALAVETQARQDHRRIADLVLIKISAQAELDKGTEQLRVAESDLKRARAATDEARQQVLTAGKNLSFQKERLSFTEIRSPYSGLVTRRDRDPGGVVVPGSSLLQLVSTNEIWVTAWVDETASAGLALGQSARIVFRSEPGKVLAGEVARLSRETDRETREFLVDVRVRDLPRNWTLGQRAEVFIATGEKPSALAIPARFLQWRQGKPGVFIAEDRKSAWREVAPGMRGREMVEITKGLESGQRVVTLAGTKPGTLQPGQRLAFK